MEPQLLLDQASGAVESFDAEVLGARLRALRTARGLSLRETARRLDISASALSQIERGVLRPSVHRLLAILTTLGGSVLDVFADEPRGPLDPGPSDADGGDAAPHAPPVGSHAIRRAHDDETVRFQAGVTFRRLSPGPTRGVDFFESTYPPGSRGGSEHELITHAGYEVGTVTQGELTIEFPDETVLLGPGDSITYACETPHRLSNRGQRTVVATWLIVHG